MLKFSIVIFICCLTTTLSLSTTTFIRKKTGITLTFKSKTYGKGTETISYTTAVEHFETLIVSDEKIRQDDADFFLVHIWINTKSSSLRTYLICSLINLTAKTLKAGFSYDDPKMKDNIFINYKMIDFEEIRVIKPNIYITIYRQKNEITLSSKTDCEIYRKITDLNSIKKFPACFWTDLAMKEPLLFAIF
ncbi:uncharacterized protein LOC142327275 isoform X2 [Lycorma delicatula]|uniref:uncharacterized protein LOC142327275 isoform X2 n=1 Tax=Lycorma delicatula TaxID=130591 RepID=UPI003F50DEB7